MTSFYGNVAESSTGSTTNYSIATAAFAEASRQTTKSISLATKWIARRFSRINEMDCLPLKTHFALIGGKPAFWRF